MRSYSGKRRSGTSCPIRQPKLRQRSEFRQLAVLISAFALALGSLTWTLQAKSSPADAATAQWYHISSPEGGPGDNSLFGISCATQNDCVAVGGYYPQPGSGYEAFVEAWDGSSWSSSPSPSTTGFLSGVSCTGPDFCVAVGYTTSGGTDEALIETWDGSEWAVTASSVTGTAVLYSVSCVGSTFCVAVGDQTSAEETLAESWNGSSWSTMASPGSGSGEALDGVSCLSTTNCVAVGSQASGENTDTLVESWNGTSWSVVPSPSDSSFPVNVLASVSCTSSTSCMAVGVRATSQTAEVLIEEWDGSSWSIGSNTGSYGLFGVSCVSAEDCVAVGSLGVIESWDGTSWSNIPTPKPTKAGASLYDVSCTVTNCVASGEIRNRPKENAKTFVASSSPLPPTVKKIHPRRGGVSHRVTITGTNFLGPTTVTFNGTTADISSETSSKITTAVPSGATSGPVEVTTGGGTATGASFTVT